MFVNEGCAKEPQCRHHHVFAKRYALTGSDLFIPDVYHLLSVEPSLYIISLYPDTHRVPLSLF